MNGTTASNNIFALLDVEDNITGGRSDVLFSDIFESKTKLVSEAVLSLASVKVVSTSSTTMSSATLSSVGHPRNAPENSSYNGDRPPVFETQNLSYKFGERTVLNNISLKIPICSFTAFVGKSGSGKSTTAKVLSGINSNYEGIVKIMGTDLSTIAPESLYKFCTYISHRDWIFKGTIRDCLWEGNPFATEEEMWNVLSQVQLKEFVEQNGGLDFKIQEDAANLSGGQKQRLSIARALLHNSEAYIFDEATSNIDVESETAILELLHKLKSTKTIIMISHRKENCKDADQIYEFENGAITGGKK